MVNDEEIYLKCSCGSEILSIVYDDEIEQFDVAIFSLDWRSGWMHRFKLIWQILKTGTPYTDRMIVNKDDFNKLSEYIDDINQKYS